MYCGRTCTYPYPLIGAFGLYDAYSIAFASVLIGIIITLVGLLPSRQAPAHGATDVTGIHKVTAAQGTAFNPEPEDSRDVTLSMKDVLEQGLPVTAT